MSKQFRNVEQSLRRGEEEESSTYALRVWLQDHLRLVWNVVMMLILLVICLWVSIVASSANSDGSIIETIAPEVQEAGSEQIQNKVENAIRSTK
jgi:hypothetical protein